ncbi:hypothetical protein [Actinokineospora enzanensis]|uniref:hypothetical protein n=1 Tax=Actinokineospora enzanensis TaxID=155975 RepID=UPI0012ECA034|nr:hypothetical protein [Actinokineospora enzanensis]
MSDDERPELKGPFGDYILLNHRPQTTEEVLAKGITDEPWPVGVPSLVDDLNDLVKYARQVSGCLAGGTLGHGLEVDNLDSTAHRVIEACRWLQIHQYPN